MSFADLHTKSAFETTTQKTFAMIKPDCFNLAGKILSRIDKSGLTILNLCMHQMTFDEASEFYAEHKGKPFYENLVQFISSGNVIGMELMGKNAVIEWRQLLGPTNCFIARTESPNSLRALYGREGVRNCAHGSDSDASAQREINLFFKKFERNRSCFTFQTCVDLAKENKISSQNSMNLMNQRNVSQNGQSANFQQSKMSSDFSCIVIKPHVFKEGKVGDMIDMIFDRCNENMLRVCAMEVFTLNKDEVEEFFEVYKGVLPEYGLMIEEMKNGCLMAIMVQGNGSVVQSVRQMCGPHDPQVAKAIRTQSLRSVFGHDKVKNGIHCTDLEDDGRLECEFFFSVMQKSK